MWGEFREDSIDGIRRWPLRWYFGLAFGVSWGGILIILGTHGFRFSALGTTREYALIFAAMALGPSTSGLMLTALLGGHAGLRKLWSRMTRWRVDGRWYAIALLTTPLILIPILSTMSTVLNSAYTPRFQLALFPIGLIAGALEEIGWSGFATPRLLQNHKLPEVGIGLGIIWAIWHMLADYSGNITTMGSDWFLWFSVFWVATLPPYRLLMTWVYANTESVLIAALMHAGYTGWLLVLSPAVSVQQGLVWQATFAAVLWMLAGTIVILGGASQKQHS